MKVGKALKNLSLGQMNESYLDRSLGQIVCQVIFIIKFKPVLAQNSEKRPFIQL